MKPETILQSDLLDIIFLDRNKAYGAYDLRKNYDSRLLRSFAITFLLAVSFAAVRYIKTHFYKDEISTFLPPVVKDVEFIRPAEPEKKKPAVAQVKPLSKPLAEVAHTVPKIVEDDLVDKDVPDIKALENKLISSVDKDGQESIPHEISAPAENKTIGDKAGLAAPVEPEKVELPLLRVEVMPEFPGGMEAFKKFMLKNLRQPDLYEGDKVIVRVQFVVDAEGAINNIVVLQSGGRLDGEVIRVVNKMPKWKPGIQNGKFVPVYFTLPVTFIGPEM